MLDQKKIKLNFKKRRLKEIDLLTIMVVSSALLQKVGYYVKVVEENYYCDMSECTYPKVHLIFHSEEDY